jgi:arylsulfatase
LYREFPGYGGQQSVRVGDWKAIRRNLGGKKAPPATATPPAASSKLELYNLADDPNETKDLADKNPEVVARLAKLMREQHTPSKEFPFAVLDGEAVDDRVK